MKQTCYKWYTPKDQHTKVSLMRYGEWIEIYPNEVLLAHTDNEETLKSYGLVRCKGIKTFRRKKYALKAQNITRLSFTE